MNNSHRKEQREVWSVFSGAFGLDLGLEKAGIITTLAVEKDKWCSETLTRNRPGLTALQADIRDLSVRDLSKARRGAKKVFLIVGGPPCQSFSTGGKRAALSDPRGNLIYEFFRIVQEVKPAYFIFENVANFITAAVQHRAIKDRPGEHWSLKKYANGVAFKLGENREALRPEELSGSAIRVLLNDISTIGYHFKFGILNSAWFGAPQHRLRFVMIGSKHGPPPDLPAPTHGEKSGQERFSTVSDAIRDLRRAPGASSQYTERVRGIFDRIPQGGNWRSLPVEDQKTALGEAAFRAGGGKTGFFRRLAWNCPSPTITGRSNRKASALCHPEFTRPLSVRECARLQGFPDDWQFAGSMAQQYMQIGNAVPVALGEAIGHALLDDVNAARPRKHTDNNIDAMLVAAVDTVRQAARNKRGRQPTVRNGT